jgi:hypothetical protein
LERRLDLFLMAIPFLHRPLYYFYAQSILFNMKKYWMTLFTLLLLSALPMLLLFGAQAGEGVRQGLQLAYRAVLPALFPAAVVCGILSEMMEYIPLPPAFTLWITSHLCGFPLGIKTTVRA